MHSFFHRNCLFKFSYIQVWEVPLNCRQFNDRSLKSLASGSEQIREHNVSFLTSMSWVFHHIQTRVFTSMST